MTFMGLYLGPKSSALESMDRSFPELGLTKEECNEMRWIETAVYLWGVDNIDYLKDRSTFVKTFSKSKADVVRDPISMDGIKGILEMYAKQPKGSFRLELFGGMMSRIRSDATPFPHRAGTVYSIEYFVDWEEVDDDKSGEYVDWLRGVYEYMTPFVSNSPRAVYVNNVDLDLGVIDWSNRSMSGVDAVEVARSWGEKYFMGNYDRLVRAKRMIDPSNVFSHKQSIPPASSEMML
ncbi:reticuline oxidase-like [Magnolia sinica]|uniref:reticuline oxidase-like n=1 Tax=Magnolia sinica TaxID=86752 RepID=UPI00265B4139|nr:reticuline oxidase-like [Magnolia sinica]